MASQNLSKNQQRFAWAISSFTLLSISSRISLTFSMGLPLGSSSVQSMVGLKNGPGQIPWSLQPIVTIKSASIAIFAVISFGLLVEIVDAFLFHNFNHNWVHFFSRFVACTGNNKLVFSIFFGKRLSHLAPARVLNTDK